MEYNCVYCNVSFKRNCDLTKHKNTQKCKDNKTRQNNDDLNNSKIKNLEKELQIYKNKEIEFKNKIILLETHNNNLIKQLEEKDIQIKLIQEKSEEYRKIIEKSSTTGKPLTDYNFKNIESNIVDNNSFQIDIKLNDTQLNKVKYKDVPEEIVKKEIKSLKLKDNYQLEYRDIDGYINVTNLCKAGGKKFNDWNRLDKTKRFLDVMNTTTNIPVVDLLKQEQGGNGERHTWSHPQVAINIAQWISPEFDVLVSKWVYEIMLTGKVDIRNEKTTQELDKLNIENKLLKNKLKLIQSKTLEKQPRENYDGEYNVYEVTTDYREAQGEFKIGKSKNLKNRLSTLNTTDKHKIIHYVSCRNKKEMDMLENLVHLKLDSCRIEPNREWFKSEEDGDDFIRVINECKQMIEKIIP